MTPFTGHKTHTSLPLRSAVPAVTEKFRPNGVKFPYFDDANFLPLVACVFMAEIRNDRFDSQYRYIAI